MLQNGAIGTLLNFITNPESGVKKEGCWAFTNIAAASEIMANELCKFPSLLNSMLENLANKSNEAKIFSNSFFTALGNQRGSDVLFSGHKMLGARCNREIDGKNFARSRFSHVEKQPARNSGFWPQNSQRNPFKGRLFRR